MKGDSNDYLPSEQLKKYKREDTFQKINGFPEELLEREEEIIVYKNRLKDLEAAFYYNLELISERDLELSILEKKLLSENEQLREVIHERDELEDLIKVMDEKNNRKIQQFKTRLSLKEEEIEELKRENKVKVDALKRLISDVKQEQENKLNKISAKFEIQKNELIRSCRGEIEEKEKYYLLEIDHLAGKLEQANKDKEKLEKIEEENKHLKYHLEDIKRHFAEKENNYLEKIKKMNDSFKKKISKEVQCRLKPQEVEKTIQAQPDFTNAVAQTRRDIFDSEESNVQKINFLQEQNEVLKYIVKDLKKNRIVEPKPQDPGQPPGCECLAVKMEVEKVNKKFENEINNLKKILEEKQKQRVEEDAVIQSLEESVVCLKDKLLTGLQEKLDDFAGEDICAFTYNREIHNEIQVIQIEEKLNRKIDFLTRVIEEEKQIVREKLEELRKDCSDKMEKCFKSREEPEEFKSENFLQKIRLEIQKLENKIETDMKNLIRNNSENKCGKDFQTGVEPSEMKRVLKSRTFSSDYPQVLPVTFRDSSRQKNEFRKSANSCKLYYRNNFSPEKCINIVKCEQGANYQARARNRFKEFREQKDFRKVTNN